MMNLCSFRRMIHQLIDIFPKSYSRMINVCSLSGAHIYLWIMTFLKSKNPCLGCCDVFWNLLVEDEQFMPFILRCFLSQDVQFEKLFLCFDILKVLVVTTVWIILICNFKWAEFRTVILFFLSCNAGAICLYLLEFLYCKNLLIEAVFFMYVF